MCFCIFYTFLKKFLTLCIFQQKLHKNHVPWGKQLVISKNLQTISCRDRLSKNIYIFTDLGIYNNKKKNVLLRWSRQSPMVSANPRWCDMPKSDGTCAVAKVRRCDMLKSNDSSKNHTNVTYFTGP